MASNRLEVLLVGDARQLNQTFKEVGKAADDMVGELVTKSQQAALGLGAISAAGGALITSFVSKASEMESFEAQLTGLTGDANLARQKLQEMADFAATTPFDLPGVVRAGTVLTGLGQNVDAQMPRIGNLASVMRRDLSEAALIWGKSMNGSRDGLQSLFDAGLVTKEELHKFGAVLDSNNAIAVEGEINLAKLRAALEKMADTKFGGVMEQQSQTLEAALSSMGDAVGQVQASLGQGLTPAIKGGAEVVTGMLNAVRNLDPGLRNLITVGILAGTVITGMAAAGAALTSVLLPASVMWSAYTATAQKAAAASLETAVANHAASVSLVAQTEAEAAAAAALLVEAQAAVANAATKKAGIVAAEGLAIAETELAAATEAAALANAQYEASAAGVIAAQGGQAAASTGLIAKLGALVTGGLGPLIILLGLAATALAGYTAYIESNTAAQEKALAVGEKQNRHLHEQKDVTLAAAEAVKKWGADTAAAADQVNEALNKLGATDFDVTKAMAGNMMILQQLYGQLEQARAAGEDTAALEKQIQEYERRNEVLRQARNERKGTHDAEMAQQAEKEAALQREKGKAEDLLKTYKEKSQHGVYQNHGEELAALDQVLAAIGNQHKEYKNLAYDRVKLARQAAADEAAARLKVREEEVKGAEAAADAVKEQFKQGKATTDQIAQQLSLRDELAAKIRLEKAEQEAVGKTAEVRTQILKVAELENANAAMKTAREVEQYRLDAAKETAAAKLKLREQELKSADEEINALKEQHKLGQVSVEQLANAIKLREDMAAKIRLEKAEQESVGKSAAAAAQIKQAAEEENASAAKKATREVEEFRRQQARQTAQVKAELHQAELTRLESAVELTRDQYDRGQATVEQLKAQIVARDRLAEQMRREKADQDAVGKSASAQAAIRRQAEADIAATRAKAQLEQRRMDDEAASRKARERAADKEEATKSKSAEEAREKAKFDAGAGNELKLKQVMLERQKAEREAMVARARADEAAATTVADKNRIRRNLEVEIKDLVAKQVAEGRALTEELEKQKQLTQEKKDGFSLGGISGVEGAGDFSMFDVKKKAGDKKKLDQVVKDQAKADAMAAEAIGKSAKEANEATRAQMVAIDSQIKELEGKGATKENVEALDELRTKRAELAKAKDKAAAGEDKAAAKTEVKKDGFISKEQAEAAAKAAEKPAPKDAKPEDKPKDKKPEPAAPATAEIIAKAVVEISAKLDRIIAEQQKPVDVKITGGGGGPSAGGKSTAKSDWRTTPTKTGD